MSRLINADAVIHVTIFDEEHEEHIVKEMTVEDMLDTYSNEGCPTIMPESMFYSKSAQQWIPVTDHLPDISHNLEGFMVTKNCGDTNDVFVSVFYDGRFGWWDGEHFTEDDSVIAWMPLPTPFTDPT